jgi:6-phosphogluconolactonase (cycloisomerase 2 family)
MRRLLGGASPGRSPALSPNIRRFTLAALAVLSCAAPGAAGARTLYASDVGGSRVFGYSLASDGGLVAVEGMPTFLTYAASSLVSSLDGTHVYATQPSVNSVVTSSVTAGGDLPSFGSSVGAGTNPSAIAASRDGTRVFVANAGSDSISRYSIHVDGSLASLGAATATGGAPSAIAMTPDGKRLYVANAADDAVAGFSVSSAGALTSLGPATPAGDSPAALAVTPDGQHLYAANSTAGTVNSWTIGSDGELTAVEAATSAGSGTAALAVSPDGKLLLAANSGSSSISRFLIDPITGALASAGDPTTGPSGARSVVISPDGQQAFVGGSTSLAWYDVSAPGSLTPHADSPIVTNGILSGLLVMPNQAPRSGFTLATGSKGQATEFDGRSSADDDGSVVDWQWDFGDGTTGQGPLVSHTYQQAGEYIVRLTVTDNENCSTQAIYTGQSTLCAGNPGASSIQTVTISDPPPGSPPDPTCAHDGDDGFCGTPDHKAPQVTVLGVANGASITTLDAPADVAGSVTPDPSGISVIRLRFSKSAGTLVRKTKPTKLVCRKVRGRTRCKRRPIYKNTCKKIKGRRRCVRKRVVMVVDSKVPMCLAVSGNKSYLVKYRCAKVPWVTVAAGTIFRYSLPVALGVGSYTIDAVAVDGAGNTDVLADGRNHVTFKVTNTPSNQSTGGGTGTSITDSTPVTPIDDTGSPFGHG